MNDKIIFQEKQRFNQWWLWLIIISLAFVPLLQFNFKENLVSQLTIDKLITSVIVALILVLFLTIRMTTSITNEKIIVYFFPFVKKEFNWRELNHAQVIDYGFIGGWGIRLRTDYGTAYNLRDSKGLHIKTDDKQFIIGTQKEEELRSNIAHLLI